MWWDASNFKTEFSVAGGACFRRGEGIEERVVPWGEDAGAWRRLSRGEWREYLPPLRLEHIEAMLAGVNPREPARPSRRPRIECLRFLLASWPEEVKALVRPFRHANWELLQFVNRGGTPAAELLASNAALAFAAAVAGCPGGPEPPRIDYQALRGLLAGKRRRLAGALGFPEAESAVRLLAKLPAAWVSGEALDLLRQPVPQAAHLPRLTPAVVAIAADARLLPLFSFDCLRALASIRHPDIADDLRWRALERVEAAEQNRRPLPRFRSLADLDPVVVEAQPEPRPPRRLTGPFPPPPIPEIERIRAIRNADDLYEEGLRMHHCVGTYAREVMSGRGYIYRMEEPERATIRIRFTRNGWRLAEAKGVCNAQLRGPALNLIRGWLRAACPAPPGIPEEVPEPAPRPVRGRAPAGRRVPARQPDPRQLAFDFGAA